MSNITEKSVGTFFPPLYDGVSETDQIVTTEDTLFSQILIDINKYGNNRFIMTADSDGLTYYERLLGIYASPSDTLTYRRQRVLSRVSTMPPFTFNFMVTHLTNIIGEGNFTVSVDPSIYTLTVRIKIPAREFFSEAEIFVNQIAPANLVLDISLIYNTYVDLSVLTYGEMASYTYLGLREEQL